MNYYTVECRLTGLIGTLPHPDIRITQIIGHCMFFNTLFTDISYIPISTDSRQFDGWIKYVFRLVKIMKKPILLILLIV